MKNATDPTKPVDESSEDAEDYGKPPTRADYARRAYLCHRRIRRLEEALAGLLAAKNAARYSRRLPDEMRAKYRELETEAWALAHKAWEERND